MKTEEIAELIFKQYGLKLETATRAGGWTNAVWFNGDIVLRLSLAKGSSRIKREIELSQMLPHIVGYPINVSKGVIEDYEWSISKRIKGVNLSEAWPNLTWVERTHAVKQIWEVMQTVHTVEIGTVEELSSRNPWYSSIDADEILPQFETYIKKGIFTPEQGNVLINLLKRFWDKLPQAKLVLNHGDITMDNILWNEGEIVSLMDFEHSVIAPKEIDLNSFINLAFFYEDDYTPVDKGNAAEFEQYKLEITELLNPILKQPDCLDLLYGYAILFHKRFLDFWLEEPEGSLDHLKAYTKLISFTEKDSAYLFEILM